jgi:hypothetical protein
VLLAGGNEPLNPYAPGRFDLLPGRETSHPLGPLPLLRGEAFPKLQLSFPCLFHLAFSCPRPDFQIVVISRDFNVISAHNQS